MERIHTIERFVLRTIKHHLLYSSYPLILSDYIEQLWVFIFAVRLIYHSPPATHSHAIHINIPMQPI